MPREKFCHAERRKSGVLEIRLPLEFACPGRVARPVLLAALGQTQSNRDDNHVGRPGSLGYLTSIGRALDYLQSAAYFSPVLLFGRKLKVQWIGSGFPNCRQACPPPDSH